MIHIAAISQIRLETDAAPTTDANEPRARNPSKPIRCLKLRDLTPSIDSPCPRLDTLIDAAGPDDCESTHYE
jgi:hypothetical protein